MKVTIDGIGELRFSFRHREDKNGTVCKCEFNGEAYFAASTLAPGDQFRKDKGRRVSLARLLKRGLLIMDASVVPFRWVSAAAFNREHRAQVWAAYFNVHSDLKGGK
mgnify:CR=1 FL=1|tara:strand:+ start:4700 stop:5020 length:321 start_codon:yes stop_codon:yes gene_type:complete